MSSLRPLFRFDPGWLFTVAGLTLLVISALLPAQQDLANLTEQLAKLEHQEKVNQKRIGAYAQFLVELKAKDPSLLTRLAASQLNLMPKGEAPVLVATSMEHTVSDWIEATVPPEAFEPNLVPDTLLTRLASGQRRLWLMGGGALIVFIGLTTGIPLTPSTRLVATALEEKWLEETRTPTNFASESQASVAQVDMDDSPQPLDYDIDLPLETSFEIAAEQSVQQGNVDVGESAGESVGESAGESAEKQLREVSGQGAVVGQWPTSSATESSVAVDDDMADGKWTWDAHANVEPYILISHAESGNSVEGASNVGASGEGEGLWPNAAD